MKTPLINAARWYAMYQHDKCNHRYGNLPYWTHLQEVADAAEAWSKGCGLTKVEAELAIVVGPLRTVLEVTMTKPPTSLFEFATGIGMLPAQREFNENMRQAIVDGARRKQIEGDDVCIDWSDIDDDAYDRGDEGTCSDLMRQAADDSTRMWRSSHADVMGQHAVTDGKCRIISMIMDVVEFYDGGTYRCDGTHERPFRSLARYHWCHAPRGGDGTCVRCGRLYMKALE